jgi:hypothetical protein
MNSHNSGTNAPVFQLEILESSLAERYKVPAHLNVQKHQAFNTYEARLQSFDCGWPHDRPDTRLLNTALFFYTGTDLTPTIVQIVVQHYTHVYIAMYLSHYYYYYYYRLW